MPLDSDTKNADEKLYVEFYEYHGDDKARHGETFIRKMVPGDKTNIIDRPMRESDKAQFHRQYIAFTMKGADGLAAIGLDLAVWQDERPDDLTRNQLDELRILKFQTVEQIATATDAQLQRIGMSGVGLRNKAQMYIQNRNAAKATGEVADLKAQLAELKEMLVQSMGVPKPKGKGGRPKKVVEPTHEQPSA